MHQPDADAVRGARFDWSLARRAWTFVRPYRGPIVGYLVLLAVASAVTAATPLVFRRLLDNAIPARSMASVNRLVALAVALQLAASVARVASTWLNSRVSSWVMYDLRVALYDRLQRLPMTFFTRAHTGSVLTRINDDVATAQSLFTGSLTTFLANSLNLVLALVAMIALSWQATAMILTVLIGVLLPSRRLGQHMQRLTKRLLDRQADMNSLSAERLNAAGALLVKLFGQYDRERAQFATRAAGLRDTTIRRNVVMAAFGTALGTVAVAATASVYWWGAWSVIQGALTIGTVVALVTYVHQLSVPLFTLSNARVEVMTAFVAFERVFEVLDAPIAIQDQPGALSLPERIRGDVALNEVWFRYPAGDPAVASLENEAVPAPVDGERAWVLQAVSLHAAPGTMTALVGASGAGKTSLSSLLPRLYDVTSGSVTVEGVDVRCLDLASLTRHIGVVSQDVHLFHDTVAANLRFARPEATDDELVAACRAARVHDVIAALPDGYETVVGERGFRFSGGEKQRLAIARLLLKDPAIVILDEATAHLDSETESEVQAALLGALAGRTSIVIAHRLSTVAAADQIAVMDAGRIVERGTHAELLARRGAYWALHESQFRAAAS